MQIHTNVTLYGGEFLSEIEDCFEIANEKHIIDTWKVLTEHKNYDRFGYLVDLTNLEKSRFENLLWRIWYMKSNRKNKIDFTIEQRSLLTAPIVIV
jgi:hypothetical protein